MVSLIIVIVIKQVYKKTDHISIIIHLCHNTTAIILTATIFSGMGTAPLVASDPFVHKHGPPSLRVCGALFATHNGRFITFDTAAGNLFDDGVVGQIVVVNARRWPGP